MGVKNVEKKVQSLNLGKSAVFLGDLHIEQDSIEECIKLAEYISTIKADTLIQLGDWSDCNKFTTDELYCSTYMANLFKSKFKNVIVIQGNHDLAQKNKAIIDYLEFLGITILHDDSVVSINNVNFRLGHWFIDKSWDAFGKYRYKLEDLTKQNKKDKVKYTLLGHQHNFQDMSKKDYVFHLGSARYVNFGENGELPKHYAYFNGKSLELKYIEGLRPLINATTIEDLIKAPSDAKVRYIFKSFKQLKDELDTVNELGKKYFQFKKKLDFDNVISTGEEVNTEKKNTKQIIKEWLKQKIDDPEVKKLLVSEFKKEFA